MVESYQTLLELKHHDLGIRSEAERRSPSSCSARREDLHFSDPAQAINKLPVTPPRHPTPRYELPQVSVPGELQGNTRSFRDFRMVRGVRQQNAGAVAIQTDLVQG